jgi:hypothetical protein
MEVMPETAEADHDSPRKLSYRHLDIVSRSIDLDAGERSIQAANNVQHFCGKIRRASECGWPIVIVRRADAPSQRFNILTSAGFPRHSDLENG